MLGTRFLSLYHITNAILASSYLFIREWYPRSTVRGPSQLMGSMGVTMVRRLPMPREFPLAAHLAPQCCRRLRLPWLPSSTSPLG